MKKVTKSHFVKQVLFGFGLLIIVYILSGIISLVKINDLGEITSTIHRHPLEVSNAALKVSRDILKIHNNIKAAVSSKDTVEAQHRLDRVSELEEQINQELDLIEDKILGSEGLELAKKTREIFTDRKPIRDNLVSLIEKGEFQKAAFIRRDMDKGHISILGQSLAELSAYARDKADGFINQAAAIQNRVFILEIFIVSLGTLLALVIAFFTIKEVAKSLSLLTKSEVELRKSENKLRNFMMSANDGFILYDSELNLSEINDNALEIFPAGVTKSDLIGKNILEIAPYLKDNPRFEKYLNVLKTGIPLASVDAVTEGAFGEKRLSVKAFPAGDGLGFIVTDITHQRKLEERLLQAQKMESIGTLAGGIAHDFNNILGAIIGYAEMARDDSPKKSSVANDLDKVLEASSRAVGLVKQILAFSRQDEIEYVPIQPASVTKKTIEMLRSTLPTTIEITQDIDPETGLVFADPTQLHQILMNLCINAFHAMEETGGKLDILLKEIDLSDEDLTHEPHIAAGTFIKLSVCDSGPGISLKVRDKIFDPYFTTKEVGKGTGLGLSIIHGIVKNYGGFITLYSELGQGAVFHVFLPIITKEVLPDEEAINQIPLGKEKILFIDDEDILADMGKDMLGRLGYYVTVRKSSLEALETFQNQPDQFDIVITDQTMPGMTGVDLARRMLQIRPDIPIILCTGYSSIISEEKAKSLGIKEFVLKPLTKKDIATVLRKVLDTE